MLEYFRYFHGNPQAGDAIGRKAREFALECSWEKVAAKYLDIISIVMKNRAN
jgi:hypothetical protein